MNNRPWEKQQMIQNETPVAMPVTTHPIFNPNKMAPKETVEVPKLNGQYGEKIDYFKMVAGFVGRSGLFKIQNEAQLISLMLIADAEGLHPIEAARQFNVIQNTPALKGEAMLARFQKAGGKVKYLQMTDLICEMEFSHSACEPFKLAWTMERAQRAGIAGKDTWKKFPRAMLKWRVVSEGIRACYPACILGFYEENEAQDIVDEKWNKKEVI